MGDADLAIEDELEREAEIEVEVDGSDLNVLDGGSNFLQALEQLLLETLSSEIKKFIYCRNFFLAMNFILLPLILAIGVCHGLQEMAPSEKLKDALQITITLLFYLTGCLGVLLYIGSLWTVYILALSPDEPDDEEPVDEEPDDVEPDDLESQPYEEDNDSSESALEENASTEELEY